MIPKKVHALALLTAFGVAAGTAWAGEAATEVKITDEVDVAGKLISNDALCKDERKVVLLQKLPGKDDKIGTDNADGKGKFSFGNPGLEPGKYYVKAKTIPGTCAKGVSDTFKVSGPSRGTADSEVTIKNDGGDFFGKVKSEVSFCKGDRDVKLLKKQPGKDEKIASDTTEDNGEWSTGNTGETQGSFYAKVKAAGDCEGAKSKTIKL